MPTWTKDKKSSWILLGHFLIFTIFSFALILGCGGCSPSEENVFPSTRKFINEYVSGDSKRIKYKDTHGRFHGDGELWAIYQLTETGRRDFEDRIANDPEWKKLPVFEDARTFVGEEWVNSTNGKYFFFMTFSQIGIPTTRLTQSPFSKEVRLISAFSYMIKRKE